MHPNNKESKEPWFAATLSLAVPGAGQVYAGDFLRGILSLVFNGLLNAGIFYILLYSDFHPVVSIVFLSLFFAFRVWVVFDAHRLTKNKNDPDFESLRTSSKDPLVAVFLTLLVPGAGHLYLKQKILACILLFVNVMLPGWLITSPPYILPLGLIIEILFTFGLCTHIWWSTANIRKTSLRLTLSMPAIYTVASGITVVASLMFIHNLFQAFSLPPDSPGMSPTLQSGDRMIVNKMERSSFNRGDILVFYSPDDPDYINVLRIIAFEDETVEIQNYGIYIDDKLLEIDNIDTHNFFSDNFDFAAKGSPYKVPKNHVFMVGDNLKKSYDCRYFGPVRKADIIGVAHKIFWPINRTKMLR